MVCVNRETVRVNRETVRRGRGMVRRGISLDVLPSLFVPTAG
jgi:hypothetical protein